MRWLAFHFTTQSGDRRRRRHFALRLVALFGLLAFSLPAPGTAQAQTAGPGTAGPAVGSTGDFAPGHVLIGWKAAPNKAGAEAAVHRNGWTVLRTLDPLPAALVEVPEGAELEAVARLRADPAIAYAELDTLAFAPGAAAPGAAPRAAASSTVSQVSAAGVQPDDPGWGEQWAPRRVKAPEAWELTTGSAAVVVAVVDSGIDLAHPEFAGRLLGGFDYVQWDTVPQDEYGHGTHVAGIIAAAGNNRTGVAGLGWQIKLLPLRVLDRNGMGTASNVAAAINNAANQRADVINLSLTLSGPSETVLSAILYARDNGAVIVASAGNDTLPGQSPAPVRYPARYGEVIAVAATTHWEDWAPYANGGPEVDLAAPGGDSSDPILSTGLAGSMAQLYGTSMAAAHVSGAAALLRSSTPSLSQNAVANILISTAEKVGSYPYVAGRNDRLGYGRLQVASALRRAIEPALVVTPDNPTLLATQGRTDQTAEIQLANSSGQPLQWQVISADPWWLTVNPAAGGGLAYPLTVRLQVGLASQPPLGLTYGSILLRTTDPSGQQRDTVITVRIVVSPQLRLAFVPSVGKGTLAPVWQDLVGGGIGLTLDDDGAQPVPLPFDFPFYGRWTNQVWVNANGFLSLERGYAGSDYAPNGCLPSLYSPNGAIYALWDDLNPAQAGRIVYGSTVDGGFAVEWRDVPTKVNGRTNTFQVVLRADGQITIAYRQVGAPNSATVGLESWDASLSWQESCNTAGRPPLPGTMRMFQAALPSQ